MPARPGPARLGGPDAEATSEAARTSDFSEVVAVHRDAFGGVIGIERERKGKPAGFRTNILICLGAAFFMQIGELLQARLNTPADVSRIAAQVASGVGFPAPAQSCTRGRPSPA